MTQPFIPKLVSQIRNEGHKLILINPKLRRSLGYENKNQYLKWLGRSLENDALETYSKILEINPDVL